MADQLRALVSARPLKFALLGLLGLAIWLRAQVAADPLSEVDCAALAALSVFSHRGLSGEGNERPESAIPTAASLVALSERGVAHFDMDLFFTDEAEQYVAHPDALAKVLGVPDVGALSSRQLARNILDADTLSRLYDHDRHVNPFAMALDFDSAFPSVSQKWLIRCVSHVFGPCGLVDCIVGLYFLRSDNHIYMLNLEFWLKNVSEFR